jgi:hypothetical protein
MTAVNSCFNSTCVSLLGHPRAGHEGPEGEHMYSSTLPSTLVLDGGGWSKFTVNLFLRIYFFYFLPEIKHFGHYTHTHTHTTE